MTLRILSSPTANYINFGELLIYSSGQRAIELHLGHSHNQIVPSRGSVAVVEAFVAIGATNNCCARQRHANTNP